MKLKKQIVLSEEDIINIIKTHLKDNENIETEDFNIKVERNLAGTPMDEYYVYSVGDTIINIK